MLAVAAYHCFSLMSITTLDVKINKLIEGKVIGRISREYQKMAIDGIRIHARNELQMYEVLNHGQSVSIGKTLNHSTTATENAFLLQKCQVNSATT